MPDLNQPCHADVLLELANAEHYRNDARDLLARLDAVGDDA